MPMEALTPKERAEVEVEVALLAELQHPNIVRYYNQCVCLSAAVIAVPAQWSQNAYASNVALFPFGPALLIEESCTW